VSDGLCKQLDQIIHNKSVFDIEQSFSWTKLFVKRYFKTFYLISQIKVMLLYSILEHVEWDLLSKRRIYLVTLRRRSSIT